MISGHQKLDLNGESGKEAGSQKSVLYNTVIASGGFITFCWHVKIFNYTDILVMTHRTRMD